ncbi:MAG TPA: AbrB/MazE/SpoVT family DNA-binding domain-containing protein [Nanoarchaeota archaeon]|nr:AbrB/MazE/SpoVT family DNA-binding domain-containing protein [Nanoarchaeota archaeon]HIH34199.1 AbrB/MazE/SpoVT family DNA-binding domain-containing protein [Nanoarchaeota archaeon]HIH51425.1 AbrB/MazE/SpoVT family DNA-binding domain-containing protein [Nanoarchaeota archaeon]HIH66081.1 AbrB/MazE/SpoVT family DNA-binding domain-containing protein [Nanoarchaeota archaeon]
MVQAIKTKVKVWGNSLGIVLPREIVINERIRPEDEVTITITKKENLEDFFGKIKSKIDAQKMKDESRKMWKMN